MILKFEKAAERIWLSAAFCIPKPLAMPGVSGYKKIAWQSVDIQRVY